MPEGPMRVDSVDSVDRGHERAQDAVAGQGCSAPGAGGHHSPAMLPAPRGELDAGIWLADPQCKGVLTEWHLGLRHFTDQSWWR